MKKYKKLNLRVAITDGSYKHTLGIVRKLGESGLRSYVLSDEKWSLAGLSRFSKGELFLSKSFSIEELIGVLKNNSIQLLILVGTNSFKKIVPWKKILEKIGVKIITVENDVQNIALSKKATYELAKKLGVPIPETIYPAKLNEIEAIKNFINYPCVIKGLYEVGGNIVDYAKNPNELAIKYNLICEKYELNESTGLPMIQEYIPGDGCAFFAIYNNGNCGQTFQHKRIREYPVTGGASSCAESYKMELLDTYGRKLLDELNWHGVAMVEFKLNNNGIPVLMEINPKFWGSTDLALEAGVDFAGGLVDIYLGEDVGYSNEYKYPLRYHWPFDGDIQHVFERPKNLIAFLIDLCNINVKSNLRLSDPLPTIYMISKFVWSIFLKLKRKIYV